jgi:dihydroorotase
MSALSKMTIQSARLVERRCPDLASKGRLQVGADADITVFDPATVADQSTIADPAQRSIGIEWVAVEGQLVLNPDGPIETALPGRALRSDITSA